jgi:hypothetical protein
LLNVIVPSTGLLVFPCANTVTAAVALTAKARQIIFFIYIERVLFASGGCPEIAISAEKRRSAKQLRSEFGVPATAGKLCSAPAA